MSDNYNTLKFDTASDFLLALRPSHSDWLGKSWRSPWIFRGQGDADWKLTPSAWRPGVSGDAQYKDIFEDTDENRVEKTIRDNEDWLRGVGSEKRGLDRR